MNFVLSGLQKWPHPPSNIGCQQLQPPIDPTALCVRIISDTEGKPAQIEMSGNTLGVHIKSSFYTKEKTPKWKSNRFPWNKIDFTISTG